MFLALTSIIQHIMAYHIANPHLDYFFLGMSKKERDLADTSRQYQYYIEQDSSDEN